MALAHNPRIVTDGLVLCLDAANPKSYPGSGATWSDMSGNQFSFTNDGAVYNSDGYFSVFGGGQNLESSDANLSFSVTSGITIEAWIRKNGTGTSRQRIVELYNSSFGAADSHALIFETDNRLIGWVNNSSGTREFELFSTQSFGATTDWKHIVLTFNNSNGASLYIDGTVNNTNSATAASISSIDGAILGAISNIGGTYAHTSYDFVGDISNVKVYSKALTAAEVAQNFNAIKGRYGL